MALKKYILIVLISIGTYLIIGWLTGSIYYSLLGAGVMALINIKNILIKLIKSDIDVETEQEKENREIHTKDLKAMIQLWTDYLPEIPLTEEITNKDIYDKFNILFIEKIEALPFFEDKDFFYHFSNLESMWNNFKTSSKNYRLDKRELYKLMRAYISQRLKNRNFNELELNSGFCVSVYIELIIEARGKVSEYKYFKTDAGNQKDYLFYCKEFKGGNRDDSTCNLLAITNDSKKIERLHADIIKECKTQYISQSKKLIEMESELRKSKYGLSKALKTARYKPSRMDCSYVKIKKEGK